MTEMIQRIALKAVIVNSEKKVLVLREASTYEEGSNISKWGLPGGRLDIGENWQDGLSREVREECAIEIEIVRPIYIGEWRPVIREVPHQIVGFFIVCKPLSIAIKVSEEHDAFAWITFDDMQNYNFMPTDDEVIKTLFNETQS